MYRGKNILISISLTCFVARDTVSPLTVSYAVLAITLNTKFLFLYFPEVLLWMVFVSFLFDLHPYSSYYNNIECDKFAYIVWHVMVNCWLLFLRFYWIIILINSIVFFFCFLFYIWNIGYKEFNRITLVLLNENRYTVEVLIDSLWLKISVMKSREREYYKILLYLIFSK